jgi:hypothetical protein
MSPKKGAVNSRRSEPCFCWMQDFKVTRTDRERQCYAVVDIDRPHIFIAKNENRDNTKAHVQTLSKDRLKIGQPHLCVPLKQQTAEALV